MKAKITNMKTKEQIIEILKRKVQNLIVEDTISPLFWEDFADELQTKELTDEEIEAVEFIVDNPDCHKYWRANVKQFIDSEGEATDNSCELSDEWQKRFEIAIIAINTLAKWYREQIK